MGLSLGLTSHSLTMGFNTAQGYDLNRRIAHFAQKTVDNGSMQQNVPTRALRLTENHMRDPFAPSKINQRISNSS